MHLEKQEMKLNGGRSRLTWAAAFVIALVGAWCLLDSGFCFSKMRYLSDKELIAEAIRYNANDMKTDTTDEAIDAFLKQNPRCCEVDRHPSTRNFLDVCSGFNISEVTLNYERKALKTPLEPFYQIDVAISACGEALKRTRGMGYSMLQEAR